MNQRHYVPFDEIGVTTSTLRETLLYSRAMKVAETRIAGSHSVRVRIAQFGKFQRA